MRTVIVFLLVIAGNTSAFAQSMLKVSTADRQVINVAVDGRYFNKSGTSVTVGDLPPGNHYLQVYEMALKRNGRGREVVVYEGKVTTDNGMITIVVFDPESGRTDEQEQDINNYVSDHPLPPGAPAGNNSSRNYDSNAQVASPAANNNTGTLTESKMGTLKTSVDAKKTDIDKMKVLKDGLKNEKIITDQVAYMMDWLNFESSKLEFVEWAYNLTVDKENYNLLDAKFTYKNYQDDFDKFIKDQK